MNPSDVNRINHTCYYTGQNLDYLVRDKMRSESFITPLQVTPHYYEDEVSKKMKLLGNRGHYFPDEIPQPNRYVPTPQRTEELQYQTAPPQRYVPTPQRAEEISIEPKRDYNLDKYNEDLERKLQEQEEERRRYEEYLRKEAEKKKQEEEYYKYQQRMQSPMQNYGAMQPQTTPQYNNYHYRNKY